MHRAVHQSLEGGFIFRDPYALQILDDEARAGLPAFANDTSQRSMRLFIAARSRFSEEAMTACVARGARQVVILGAGLDTFSLRNPHAGVTVYEIDYPATQAWKRERLAEAGVALPPWLTFAPIDFERQSLAEGLASAGFRGDQPPISNGSGSRRISPVRPSSRHSISSPASPAPRSRSTTPSPSRTIRRPRAPI